jgi:hypothetical protein
LIHLRGEVTPKWYELGEIIGVPKETLDKFSEHPPEQCIIEVLDYWLMLHSDKLTWKDVAHALEELNLHQLSEKILQISEKRNKSEANGMQIKDSWTIQNHAHSVLNIIQRYSCRQCKIHGVVSPPPLFNTTTLSPVFRKSYCSS